MSAFLTNSDLEYNANVRFRIADGKTGKIPAANIILRLARQVWLDYALLTFTTLLSGRMHRRHAVGASPPEVAQLTAIPHLWTLIFQNSEPNLLPTSSLWSLSRLPVVKNMWSYTLLFVFSFLFPSCSSLSIYFLFFIVFVGLLFVMP